MVRDQRRCGVNQHMIDLVTGLRLIVDQQLVDRVNQQVVGSEIWLEIIGIVQIDRWLVASYG